MSYMIVKLVLSWYGVFDGHSSISGVILPLFAC